MTEYDGLVLDYDGVLVTVLGGEARLQAVYRLAHEEFRDGGLVPDEGAIERLAHSISLDEVHSLGDRLDAAPEALWRARDDVLATVFEDAARTGAKRLYPDVAALADVEVPMGIASNNQRRVIEFSLDEFDLRDRFETVHARDPDLDSLKLKKPDPVFLERAQADLGVSSPLYVGDKQKDVIAARRAGMDVAFIRRDHNHDHRLEYEPTYEVRSLEEVVALFG